MQRSLFVDGFGGLQLEPAVGAEQRLAEVGLVHGATARAGVNSNILTDEKEIDPLSGNSVLNGIPVKVTRISHN